MERGLWNCPSPKLYWQEQPEKAHRCNVGSSAWKWKHDLENRTKNPEGGTVSREGHSQARVRLSSNQEFQHLPAGFQNCNGPVTAVCLPSLSPLNRNTCSGHAMPVPPLYVGCGRGAGVQRICPLNSQVLRLRATVLKELHWRKYAQGAFHIGIGFRCGDSGFWAHSIVGWVFWGRLEDRLCFACGRIVNNLWLLSGLWQFKSPLTPPPFKRRRTIAWALESGWTQWPASNKCSVVEVTACDFWVYPFMDQIEKWGLRSESGRNMWHSLSVSSCPDLCLGSSCARKARASSSQPCLCLACSFPSPPPWQCPHSQHRSL